MTREYVLSLSTTRQHQWALGELLERTMRKAF
ncbi:hypothetical protein KGO5_03160 [Sinorhizobium sp. KGO-5]|jgi:hypothetical protein|nr:hypothetical protein KGO5_03160 [Sinorhizobium sp. KGO-5]